MRILCLTAVPPWPAPDGGRRRTSELLGRAAARPGVELHVLTVAGRGDAGDAGATGEHGKAAGTAPAALAGLEVCAPSPLPPARAPLAARPERWFHSAQLARRVAERLAREPFDLVHLDEPCLLRALPPRTPPVVVHHHKLDLDLARALGRPWHERARLARLERQAVRRGALHVTSAEEDRARLLARHAGRLEAARVVPIPCGADTARLVPGDEAGRDPRRLLFLGSLDYEPNRRALGWLLDEAWPVLHARVPSARLEVVGSGAAPDLRARAEGRPGVEWVGRVPDVRPHLRRAGALLAPLDVGGGSRVKIVEALSCACPVLTTPVGAAGLPLDGRHLERVELGPRYVRALLDLVAHPAVHRRRARAGQAFVRAHLDWQGLAEQLVRAWAALERPLGRPLVGRLANGVPGAAGRRAR